MIMNKLLLLLAFFFLLSACAPDPRNAADADATRLRAEQFALDTSQTRSNLAAQQALDLQAQQDQQATNIAAHNRLVTAASWSIILILLASTVIFSVSMWQSSQAFKVFSMRRAEVQANLIPLDPVTRQYPLFILYNGKGSFNLTNPNTGQVLLLDTNHEPDRQAIAAAAQVQTAGVLAVQAARAHSPQAIDKIRPTIIDADGDGLKVGEIFNNMVDMLNRPCHD
jgi:hypothetical protein